ncbi:SDR family oxidoreductase [Roseovarius sp. LXJ103]|uniref:NAD-dependent epimerase/dehydratase family protein n=1 Tax=Roseovarius carneus TaxID=2853164 RepID=UPI0015E8202F|nr:SDR family oxidoreductase [Roseovarius carneus]MBZ8118811.1 SDR family oxidoreductase [Roseovarius carneus]
MPALDGSGLEARRFGAARPDWLMVGASGRVGRMMRAAWPSGPDARMRIVPQMRVPQAGQAQAMGEGALCWAPLEGPEPFERYVRADGTPAAMLMLAGVIPGAGADYTANVGLAVACLEAAKEAGCGRVIIASSAAVYDPFAHMPVAEDGVLAPASAYGASKLAMEQACAPYRALGIDVCSLRIGDVLGADGLMRNAHKGRPLVIDRFADGRGPMRSYIGPATLARVLGTLAASPDPLPEVLNVAAPFGCAMVDIAEAAGLDWAWRDAPVDAVQNVTLETARLEEIYTFARDEVTARDMVAQLRHMPRAQ